MPALLERLLGAPKVLLTTSCTHALELTALLLDVRPGDEDIQGTCARNVRRTVHPELSRNQKRHAAVKGAHSSSAAPAASSAQSSSGGKARIAAVSLEARSTSIPGWTSAPATSCSRGGGSCGPSTRRGSRNGIGAIFHQVPLHVSEMGRRFGGRAGDRPVTEDISDRLVRLPPSSVSRIANREVIAAILAFPLP